MQTQSLFDKEGEVLRISNSGDDVVNEYRISRKGLEFRGNGPGAHDWRDVTGADLEMHIVLRTPVAKWVERRKSDLLEAVLDLAAQHQTKYGKTRGFQIIRIGDR